MARILKKCPKCGKIARVKESQFSKLLKKELIFLACGHMVTKDLEIRKVSERDSIWLKAYPFQQEGVKFLEDSNYNAALTDEMGIGKTIQALLAYRYNQDKFGKILVIGPSGLCYNWAREYLKWAVPENAKPIARIPYIHQDGKLPLLPGFIFYFVSMDLIAKPVVKKSIRKMKFKLLIIDEAHNFKNPIAKRTQGLIEAVGDIPHKIALSGTAIKNRFTEYFTILNLIKPEHWPDRAIMNQFADYDWSTKRYLGISPNRLTQFQDMTKGYILRRTKAEVLDDLPPIQRTTTIIDVTDNKNIVMQYNKILDELERAIAKNRTSKSSANNLLGLLSNLRHLCGIAKCSAITELALNFLESHETDKLAIGVHHVNVVDYLRIAIEKKGYEVVTITGSDNAEQKDIKENEFRNGKRLLVANMIACGEGRNMQFCSNAFIAERGWNPAVERQFEGRFHRIGQTRGVQIDYISARNTIDQFFESMIEMKGVIEDQVLDGDVSLNYGSVYHLAESVVASRLEYVGF